jgi:ribosome-associated protein
MNSLELAQEAAKAAASKKAMRPVILDLRGQSDICDFQLVCSGTNTKQTQAIASAIEDHCKTTGGLRPVAIEGKQSGNWILLDYGSTIVHIFFDELRDFYAIEEIWPKAKSLKLS